MLNPLKKLKKYPMYLSISEYIHHKTHRTNQTRFFSLRESFHTCSEWAEKLPNDFDIIIGVPRAGLMFANIIACKLGRPLSTPDNFLRGEIWFSHDAPMPAVIKRVLIVEDSVGQGKQIMSAYQRIKDAFPNLQIETAGLFVIPESANKLDYSHAVKREPNLFEWNILTATWSWGDVVSDLDGVLCYSPPNDWKDTPEKIAKYIQNAKPFLIPTYPLKAIVTERAESNRDLTEKWLERYNVKYEHLIMRPDHLSPSFENVVSLKSDVAKYIKPFWFWETDYHQAEEIHRRAGVPVLCIERMCLIS